MRRSHEKSGNDSAMTMTRSCCTASRNVLGKCKMIHLLLADDKSGSRLCHWTRVISHLVCSILHFKSSYYLNKSVI